MASGLPVESSLLNKGFMISELMGDRVSGVSSDGGSTSSQPIRWCLVSICPLPSGDLCEPPGFLAQLPGSFISSASSCLLPSGCFPPHPTPAPFSTPLAFLRPLSPPHPCFPNPGSYTPSSGQQRALLPYLPGRKEIKAQRLESYIHRALTLLRELAGFVPSK